MVRRRRRRRSVALVAGVVGALAVPGAWALAADGGGGARPTLPTLPPVEERLDGLYDDQGCLRTGPAEVDCSVRADAVDEALAGGGSDEVRQLEGFVGSQYLGHPTGTGPVVLEASVAVAPGPTFVASGLARNEGTTTVAEVEVGARLLAADSSLLAEVAAPSPVHDVRPGEPVPFTVTAPVAPADVARVEWSATATGDGDDAHRALAWTPYWEQPGGQRPPVSLYLYREHGPGPHPHVLFGSVGPAAAGADVVVAWVDQGRMVATAEGRAEGGGDVLVVTGASIPATAETSVWAQRR